MDKFKEDLLSDFVLESREHLESVEPNLLDIEEHLGEDSPVAINEVFRAIHSLKGSAAFFGLNKIKDLAHVMENLLMKARDHEIVLDRNQISTLLSGTDKLAAMVEDLQNCDAIDTTEELEALQKYLDKNPSNESSSSDTIEMPVNESASKTPEAGSAPSGSVDDEIEALRKRGNKFFQITYSLGHQIHSKSKTPEGTLELLESLGKVLNCSHDLTQLPAPGDPEATQVNIVFLLATVLQEDFLYDGLEIEQSQVSAIDADEARKILSSDGQQGSSSAGSSKASETPSEVSVKKETPGRPKATKSEIRETLRVDVKTLNKLMDLAGELVLNRNQLKQVVETEGKEINSLGSLMQSINIVTSELQATIMNARLQPIGVLFNKFPRIIRDLARQLDKEIDLVIEGKDVDMDKSIIETLSDPLTHLIRNCADHAIEKPDVRVAANKPRRGKVILRAYHKSGQVYIDINDDGAGIDPEVIKAKVVEKNLRTPEQLKGLSEQEILKLIFLPGFSTAQNVTEVSGRGVGMDVVRTNIEKLGGSLHLDSTLGEGSTVTLKLPLTLAIIPSQIIDAGGVRYAIPQINLEEMVQVGGKNGKYKVEVINGKEVLRLRGDLLPLVDMNALLKKEKSEFSEQIVDDNELQDAQVGLEKDHAEDDVEVAKRNILVLSAGANRFGLIVSELLDSEEIVVKPLSSYLKACRYYAGATILGDGKVSMIVDVAGLAETAYLDFDRCKSQENVASTGSDTRGTNRKEQFFVFESGTDELFALPLQMISRVDKIRRDELIVIDGKMFFSHFGELIRLIWLHEFIPAARPDESSEYIHVILPKVVKHTIGVCATSIHDILESDAELNCADHMSRGVIGSAMIDEKAVVFLDLFGLFEMAAPELYVSPSINDDKISSQLLIADSNPAHAALLNRFCHSANLNPRFAKTGMEAFQALKDGRYKTVLTAPQLSVLDPESLIAQVGSMENGDKIRFIALTDLAQKKEADDIFDDRILKFDKHRLLEVIGAVDCEVTEV